MKLQFNATTIAGNDYNKNNVENTIASLQPSQNDIVVFYYSGHGFSKKDNRQYPYLELSSKSFQSLEEHSLNIEDIYNNLKRKNAHVTLVISDCCNDDQKLPLL